MQQAIGEIIRQVRRQRNLTQTELGGERYSKSYVSVVERSKILPSSEALQFFAEQLGQPSDFFQNLHMRQVSVLGTLSMQDGTTEGPMSQASQAFGDEELTLLDILLENPELSSWPSVHELPMLSPEIIAALPLSRQAHYYFLKGLIAQEQGDRVQVLDAFEHALAVAPHKQRPAILDELGNSYHKVQAYSTALGYHLRALYQLQQEAASDSDSLRSIARLLCKVEIHCGDDYRALSAYSEAREHYEQACRLMKPENDMKSAALLYWGLGFCTYSATHQKAAVTSSNQNTPSLEEIECEFQQAIGYLLQSRILYQASRDKPGEAGVRLTHAFLTLNYCALQRQMAQRKGKGQYTPLSSICTSLLDEAEEQCRQVLIQWQSLQANSGILPPKEYENVFAALAYLIRIYVQRAAVAYFDGYRDTAEHQLARAAYLCEQALSALSESVFPPTVIDNALRFQEISRVYRTASLLRFPNLSHLPVQSDFQRYTQVGSVSPDGRVGQIEVYFAAAELAEGLGRMATNEDYAFECYTRANSFFQEGLSLGRSALSMHECEPDYLFRYYQTYTSILEERILLVPALREETITILLDILKHSFSLWQHPLLPTLERTAAS